MPDESMMTPQVTPPPHELRRRRRLLRLLLAGVAAYFLIAFVVLPLLWHRYEVRHPALSDIPNVTHTRSDIPGDPLNVGLVGTEEQLHRGMLAAGWYPADPITIETSIRIAVGVVFKRPFDEAPVSPLYLFGRKEDFAFEKPVGDDPRRRHHVRFWKSEKADKDGRPLWIGAATFDTHVGFARDTGQFTHHVSADVDADRDLIMSDLRAAGCLASEYWIDDFHKVREGRNGEGDPWHTDGRLAVGVLKFPPPSEGQTRPAGI
jgi:hypothetical protein